MRVCQTQLLGDAHDASLPLSASHPRLPVRGALQRFCSATGPRLIRLPAGQDRAQHVPHLLVAQHTLHQ